MFVAEENQAYSAGKVQKGINFSKPNAYSEKKGALNRNEEEEQDSEGLFSSNNVYNNNNNNNNQNNQRGYIIYVAKI